MRSSSSDSVQPDEIEKLKLSNGSLKDKNVSVHGTMCNNLVKQPKCWLILIVVGLILLASCYGVYSLIRDHNIKKLRDESKYEGLSAEMPSSITEDAYHYGAVKFHTLSSASNATFSKEMMLDMVTNENSNTELHLPPLMVPDPDNDGQYVTLLFNLRRFSHYELRLGFRCHKKHSNDICFLDGSPRIGQIRIEVILPSVTDDDAIRLVFEGTNTPLTAYEYKPKYSKSCYLNFNKISPETAPVALGIKMKFFNSHQHASGIANEIICRIA